MSTIGAFLYYGILLPEGVDPPELNPDLPELLSPEKGLDCSTFGWEDSNWAVYVKASSQSVINSGGRKIQLREVKPGWQKELEAYCERNGIDPKKIGWYLSPCFG